MNRTRPKLPLVNSRQYWPGSLKTRSWSDAFSDSVFWQRQSSSVSPSRTVRVPAWAIASSSGDGSTSRAVGSESASTRRSQASFQYSLQPAWQPPWADPSQRKSSR